MADRPILFSGPMIRALIAGRKTQTRRILKPQPGTYNEGDITVTRVRSRLDGNLLYRFNATAVGGGAIIEEWAQTRFELGDRLWVRESWARVGDVEDDIHACPDMRVRAYYRADAVDPERQRWRPSIHMPRSVSRLTLAVTDLRVQRLADLTEDDAIAEGVCTFTEGLDHGAPWGDMAPSDRAMMVRNTYGSAVTAYRHLWEAINGADSWDRNPWVVALTFDVHQANIAELGKEAA